MNDAFQNKVALITGATSGIGKATALAFARGGARVVLSGRREVGGGAVVAQVQAPSATEPRFWRSRERTSRLRLALMLARTERIEGFYRKVSRTEKAFYDLFRKSEEAELLAQIRAYFLQAKPTAGGGIRFDHQALCSGLEEAVEAWIVQACSDQHLNREWIVRAEEAISHRVRTLLAQTLRELWGAERRG